MNCVVLIIHASMVYQSVANVFRFAGQFECGYQQVRSVSLRALEDHLREKFGVKFGKVLS